MICNPQRPGTVVRANGAALISSLRVRGGPRQPSVTVIVTSDSAEMCTGQRLPVETSDLSDACEAQRDAQLSLYER